MILSLLIRFSVVIIGFAFLTGCGSCVETSTSNSNSAQNILKPKRAVNAGPIANSVNTANANLKSYPGIKPGENPTLDNSKVKVINTEKGAAPPPAKRMPDNSEMLTTMKGGIVYETRRFLNNQQLVKIERITKTPGKDVIVKVHLRNGRVIDLPDSRIKNYKSDTARAILEAAGVKIEVNAAPNTKEIEEKLRKRPAVKAPVSDN